MASALTELGPYGVPVSITLPLFSEGVPLRASVAVAFLNLTVLASTTVHVFDVNTNSIVLLDAADLLVLQAVLAQSGYSILDADMSFITRQHDHAAMLSQPVSEDAFVSLIEPDVAAQAQDETVAQAPVISEEVAFIQLIVEDKG
jgi:hypothetical protein